MNRILPLAAVLLLLGCSSSQAGMTLFAVVITPHQRIAIPMIGDRICVLNNTLPPSPELDGLIKPPRV